MAISYHFKSLLLGLLALIGQTLSPLLSLVPHLPFKDKRKPTPDRYAQVTVENRNREDAEEWVGS